jgi:hypothetical protein
MQGLDKVIRNQPCLDDSSKGQARGPRCNPGWITPAGLWPAPSKVGATGHAAIATREGQRLPWRGRLSQIMACVCVFLAWSPLIRTWQQLGLTRDTWTQLNSTRLLCWCEILVDTAEVALGERGIFRRTPCTPTGVTTGHGPVHIVVGIPRRYQGVSIRYVVLRVWGEERVAKMWRAWLEVWISHAQPQNRPRCL